jgi:hypothetical protein
MTTVYDLSGLSDLARACHDKWGREAELAWDCLMDAEREGRKDRQAEAYYNRRRKCCRLLRMRAEGFLDLT